MNLGLLRKYIMNNVIVVVSGLPNLAITAGTLTTLTVFFHVFPLYAYLVGQVFSVQYGVIYSMLVKVNFTIFGRHWHYDHRDEK